MHIADMLGIVGDSNRQIHCILGARGAAQPHDTLAVRVDMNMRQARVTSPEGRAAAVGAALCCRTCGQDLRLTKDSKQLRA